MARHVVTLVRDDLRSLVVRSERLLDQVGAPFGVSASRMVLMSFVAEHGGVRSADIIKAFGQAPRTVTEAIDAMEADGHVERLPDPSDRRAKIVSLTIAGRQFFDEVNPLHERMRERIFGALSSQEQAQLAELLDKLNSRLLQLEAGLDDEQAAP